MTSSPMLRHDVPEAPLWLRIVRRVIGRHHWRLFAKSPFLRRVHGGEWVKARGWLTLGWVPFHVHQKIARLEVIAEREMWD